MADQHSSMLGTPSLHGNECQIAAGRTKESKCELRNDRDTTVGVVPPSYLFEVNDMAFEESAVRTVIEVLHDGERGFASLSEHLKEPRLKTYFKEEAATRGQLATELEAALSTAVGKSVSEGGTTTGTIHRAWAELKGSMGGSDHTLLETAEQGEDAAKRAYEAALKVNDLPAGIRTVLVKQQPHILASHDKVKSFRDSVAA